MQKLILSLSFLAITTISSAQFVARMEVKEPISGICNEKQVLVLFPMMKGQKSAVCPVSKTEILQRLNDSVPYVKAHPELNDKGMMGLVVNCKGKVVQCKIDNKTSSPELDAQIEAVFAALGDWKPGKLNGDEVDTSNLFSFKITNGVFSW